MISFNHPDHPYSGGPWAASITHDVRSKGTFSDDRTRGQLVIDAFGGVNIPQWHDKPPLPDNASLRGWGTSMIAQSEPTQSEYSLVTGLTEIIKEGFPSWIGSSLFRERVKNARSAGDEYLNQEFGWKPLVADLKAFTKAVMKSDELISQYRRDSSQKVRRSRDMGAETTVEVGTARRCYTEPRVASFPGHVIRSTYYNKRFSGAFRYYVPETPAVKYTNKFTLEARKLHGVELTPEVVWNLAPWSWALDWLGNTGDVMHNISALGRDALVMEYGYVTAVSKGVTDIRANVWGQTLTRTVTDKSYLRLTASPYGFSSSWDGLSPRQLAIVAALGLTKS